MLLKVIKRLQKIMILKDRNSNIPWTIFKTSINELIDEMVDEALNKFQS